MDWGYRGNFEEGEERGSGVCDTEMGEDLVGRWAWEISFVKIAQFFPETGAGGCVLFTKTCLHSIHK